MLKMCSYASNEDNTEHVTDSVTVHHITSIVSRRLKLTRFTAISSITHFILIYLSTVIMV